MERSSTRRWWLLCVLSIAQLMVVLDNTIVNVALPSAQAGLRFSQADRPWVVTAYALAFGSLLLLGGRLSDLFGRKRAFIIGLIGVRRSVGDRGSRPGRLQSPFSRSWLTGLSMVPLVAAVRLWLLRAAGLVGYRRGLGMASGG
ncbi:MAG TPA: MFS transporter [Streptosporangiaceae bacterium]